ncbi:MAG: FIST N-terminal domain-containing protein [Planctomycetota bacterium]
MIDEQHSTNKNVLWTSTINTQLSAAAALRDACEKALSNCGGIKPDAAFVFLSGYPAADLENIGSEIMRRTGVSRVLGCTAGGVVGGGREIEHKPSLSLTLASLPNVNIQSFHITPDEYPDGDAPPSAWHEKLGIRPGGKVTFIILPDPFSSDPQRFIDGLDYAFSNTTKLGGLASGGHSEGMNRLFLNDKTYRTGTVGFVLSGAIEVDTVVAQGCKPIGATGTVTKVRGPFLMEIDAKPALQFVQEQVELLTKDERELARIALFFGIAMDPFSDAPPAPGDFLIRNIIDVDAQRGYVAIGAQLSAGRIIQLHVRDKQTSIDDLLTVLRRSMGSGTSEPAATPSGALLFSCLGRGRHLYGEADKDTQLFHSVVGEVPLGGFFCNGEIGPVSGGTYLHGFTSSFGLFRPGAVSQS